MKVETYLPRVASSVIISFIGGIALMNQIQRPMSFLAWWLIYAVAASVALAPKRTERLSLVLGMAAAPALAPVGEAAMLQLLFGHVLRVPGGTVTPSIGVAVFFISWFGISLFAYSHRTVVAVVEWAQDPETVSRLANMERAFRAAALTVLTLALIIAGLGYSISR